MNVVIISIAPWAKLTTRVARQISTRASATAAYTAPVEIPFSVKSRNLVIEIPGGPGACSSEAQVGVTQVLVGGQRGGIPIGHHAAQVEHQAAVGDRQRAAGVLLHQ